MKYKINWDEKLPEIISTWTSDSGETRPTDGSKSPYNSTHPYFSHDFTETNILNDSDWHEIGTVTNRNIKFENILLESDSLFLRYNKGFSRDI